MLRKLHENIAPISLPPFFHPILNWPTLLTSLLFLLTTVLAIPFVFSSVWSRVVVSPNQVFTSVCEFLIN